MPNEERRNLINSWCTCMCRATVLWHTSMVCHVIDLGWARRPAFTRMPPERTPGLLDAITAGSQIKEPIQIFHDAKASFHDSVTGLQTSFFLSCNCTLPSSQVQEVHLTLWIKLTLCTSFLQLSCAPPLQFKLHTSSTLLNYAQSICHSKLHTCQSWTKAFHATSTEKTCVPLSFMLIAKAFNAKCP